MPRGWLPSTFYSVASEPLTRNTISRCRRRSALVCDIAASLGCRSWVPAPCNGRADGSTHLWHIARWRAQSSLSFGPKQTGAAERGRASSTSVPELPTRNPDSGGHAATRISPSRGLVGRNQGRFRQSVITTLATDAAEGGRWPSAGRSIRR